MQAQTGPLDFSRFAIRMKKMCVVEASMMVIKVQELARDTKILGRRKKSSSFKEK